MNEHVENKLKRPKMVELVYEDGTKSYISPEHPRFEEVCAKAKEVKQ